MMIHGVKKKNQLLPLNYNAMKIKAIQTILLICILLPFFHSDLMAQRKRNKKGFKGYNERKINKRRKQIFGEKQVFFYHNQGIKAISIQTLKGTKTTMFTTSYLHYFKDRLSVKMMISYEYGDPYQVPYEGYYFKLLGQYSLLSFKDKLFINPYLGGIVVYDDYVASEVLNKRINYGATGGIELEYTFGKLAILGSAEQQYVKGVGRKFLGGGLRFFF